MKRALARMRPTDDAMIYEGRGYENSAYRCAVRIGRRWWAFDGDAAKRLRFAPRVDGCVRVESGKVVDFAAWRHKPGEALDALADRVAEFAAEAAA
jgi:hypothetical protein